MGHRSRTRPVNTGTAYLLIEGEKLCLKTPLQQLPTTRRGQLPRLLSLSFLFSPRVRRSRPLGGTDGAASAMATLGKPYRFLSTG